MKMMVNGQEVPTNNIRVGQFITWSEEEQVVGEWINGKPVYAKTIVGTSPSKVSTLQVIGSIDDMDELIYSYGTIAEVNNSSVFAAPNNAIYFGIDSDHQPTAILVSGATAYTNKPIKVNYLYTKTTDEAKR